MDDLSIELDDRPGGLAAMATAVGAAGLSIEGGGAWSVDGRGVAHFLFADGPAAERALSGAGIPVSAVRPVLVRRLDQDRPGEMGRIATALADAGVSIEVVYSDHEHRLILVVDDVDTAERVTGEWRADRP